MRRQLSSSKRRRQKASVRPSRGICSFNRCVTFLLPFFFFLRWDRPLTVTFVAPQRLNSYPLLRTFSLESRPRSATKTRTLLTKYIYCAYPSSSSGGYSRREHPVRRSGGLDLGDRVGGALRRARRPGKIYHSIGTDGCSVGKATGWHLRGRVLHQQWVVHPVGNSLCSAAEQ